MKDAPGEELESQVPRRARVIALTGGIASGKSTVSRMLAQRGAAVVDSDAVAREVVEPGTPGLAAIVEAFGPDFLLPDGRLDRARLGALVFADPALRRRLEEITHPLIRARTAELAVEAAAAGRWHAGPGASWKRPSGPPLVVVDVPLLFEVGRQRDFSDGVLLVYADPAIQMGRLREREGLDQLSAGQRLAAQLPIESKRPLSTWVIDNSGTLEATQRQVEDWWRETVG